MEVSEGDGGCPGFRILMLQLGFFFCIRVGKTDVVPREIEDSKNRYFCCLR